MASAALCHSGILAAPKRLLPRPARSRADHPQPRSRPDWPSARPPEERARKQNRAGRTGVPRAQPPAADDHRRRSMHGQSARSAALRGSRRCRAGAGRNRQGMGQPVLGAGPATPAPGSETPWAPSRPAQAEARHRSEDRPGRVSPRPAVGGWPLGGFLLQLGGQAEEVASSAYEGVNIMPTGRPLAISSGSDSDGWRRS
jgi:hypothetical protein